MALPPRATYSSDPSFAELNDELATARDALLLFAESEGVLQSLVCDPRDPGYHYPDVPSVRRDVTVDELLHVVASIPVREEETAGDEANFLYPTLLQLAEVFDILIDQHSLVYGDAVALAESMEGGWHAMAGCCNHEPTPEEATLAVKRVSANLASLAEILDAVGRLSTETHREAADRFRRVDGEPWRAEARHLALHAVDTWLPQGISEMRLERALEPARGLPGATAATKTPGPLARATADLLLARLVRGIARDLIPDVLQSPFAGLLPDR